LSARSAFAKSCALSASAAGREDLGALVRLGQLLAHLAEQIEIVGTEHHGLDGLCRRDRLRRRRLEEREQKDAPEQGDRRSEVARPAEGPSRPRRERRPPGAGILDRDLHHGRAVLGRKAGEGERVGDAIRKPVMPVERHGSRVGGQAPHRGIGRAEDHGEDPAHEDVPDEARREPRHHLGQRHHRRQGHQSHRQPGNERLERRTETHPELGAPRRT
jgi:hypothetical protein